MAHRRQRPEDKINHALVLGSHDQGIGKDTILEPVKQAVGPWNFQEPSPTSIMGRFNGFVKSVIMRINEARDHGDVSRYEFYDRMKAYCASPPDTLRCDEKNLREHSVLNVCGPIITTNYKSNGLYLPATDRRTYVAWSDRVKGDFDEAYWNKLWHRYASGGYEEVVAFLDERDLSSFDPKAPPEKTPAFWDIVDANRTPEDAEIADIMDKLKGLVAVTIAQLKSAAKPDFFDWLADRRNRRSIGHRLESCDYVPVRNPDATDGLWRIKDERQVVRDRWYMSKRRCLVTPQLPQR